MKWTDKIVFWLVRLILGKRGFMYQVKVSIDPSMGQVQLHGLHYNKHLERHRNLVTNCEFYFGKDEDDPDFV